jgi:glutathione S-transferase
MRLYYKPGSGRPVRVAWLLEELALPYEAIAVSREDAAQHHPLGKVPVLETADGELFESTAICLALADEHGMTASLAAHERALVYQWALFAMTEIEPAYLEHARNLDRDEARASAGAEAFRARAALLEQPLAESEFLVADRLSVADVVAGGVLALALRRKLLPDPELANVSDYVQRLTRRPAFIRAAAATESSLLELTR